MTFADTTLPQRFTAKPSPSFLLKTSGIISLPFFIMISESWFWADDTGHWTTGQDPSLAGGTISRFWVLNRLAACQRRQSGDWRQEGCALETRFSRSPGDIYMTVGLLTSTLSTSLPFKSTTNICTLVQTSAGSLWVNPRDKLQQKQFTGNVIIYNSLIWPVLKPTGKCHLTIDNHPLNKQVPHLPMIHLNQEVKGARFFSTVA